jgi:hypothetical protein
MSIFSSQERMNLKYKELKEDITQISVLEDNAVAEAQLMQVHFIDFFQV